MGEEKLKYFEFLKNASTDFNKLLWVYCTFETQQHDTIDFSEKSLKVEKYIFLLSSDIRSEGSIAIVKIFDFDFFMIFHSTSLPHPKKVIKKCVSVCVCVTVAEHRA